MIVFLVLGRQVPSTRFRVLSYLPFLEKRGIPYRLFEEQPVKGPTLLGKFHRWLLHARALRACAGSDLVFLQKPGFIAHRRVYIRLLFLLSRRVVFDFDDAVFIDPASGRPQPRAVLKKLELIVRRSSAVIAGNGYLAGFAGRFHPRVEVIPTPLDCDRFSPGAGHAAGAPLTIGWVGTRSNLRYLFRLLPVMERVLEQAGARLLVISNLEETPAVLRLRDRVQFRTWRAESEVVDLRLFDIGVMPLDDDAYARGKCGFKLLQYMAVGIPVVASPVGANAGIVEDGVNGFLAGNGDEWQEKLLILCRDWDLRQKMGRAGREKVVREYSLRKAAESWLPLVMRAAGLME